MRKAVTTSKAPKAIGPYSQAVKCNGLIFVSGQVAIDPATQQVIEGDVAAKTERVMKNLYAILEASGSKFDQVLRTTVFMQNMYDFAAMNAGYSKYFIAEPTARSTVYTA